MFFQVFNTNNLYQWSKMRATKIGKIKSMMNSLNTCFVWIYNIYETSLRKLWCLDFWKFIPEIFYQKLAFENQWWFPKECNLLHYIHMWYSWKKLASKSFALSLGHCALPKNVRLYFDKKYLSKKFSNNLGTIIFEMITRIY